MEQKEIIIIGSGPAGLTAAIYASRAGYIPLVIEGVPSGGQLLVTTDVENYPGFPEGIPGPELIENMRKQAERFGTRFVMKDVTAVDLSKYPFRVTAEDTEYTAKSLIIATGAKAKYLDLPSVERFKGRGVSGCATCDGFFFRDSRVFVIGGGDTAAEEALFLTRFAREVIFVHRRDKLRTEKYVQEKLFNNPKIRIMWDSVVEEIKGSEDKGVEKIVLKNIKTGDVTEHEADGVFMGIGYSPATSLFRGQLELDEAGYIISHDGTKTSVKGVFAAGDVRDPMFRQAVAAAGTGCKAAIEAERFLDNMEK
ncbi:MAG: thioredoxin-disulfide reductase [Deltaproteobacteria bacterium]|nr:thioredoxin-disulfide reductase [Deltaproteobacteria bacterium]